MGWTNSQAQTIVGLAFTYFTTTVLFSTGSTVTFGPGSTFQSDVDLNLTSPAGVVWDGAVRIDRDDAGIDVNGRAVLTANGTFFNQLATPDTTTSATYVDVADAVYTITKLSTNSALIVRLGISCYSTAVNTIGRFGVTIDGGATDTDISQVRLNAANDDKHCSGIVIIGESEPPGVYTVQVRWKRVSGAGTLTRDASDIVSMELQEG